ncbi:MAG: hypothetical protein Q4B48_06745 [Syntrophomonadaceae bacterium]|nr:hypothetical protein [Syntrophomonadaceae bacterium]
MKTLVATVLRNAKDNDIYCFARRVTERDMALIRSESRETLEAMGFEFIRLISLDVEGVKGYAIFYPGHPDEMSRALRKLN